MSIKSAADLVMKQRHLNDIKRQNRGFRFTPFFTHLDFEAEFMCEYRWLVIQQVYNSLMKIHGHTSRKGSTSTYYSWKSMKCRCLNPNATRYHRYGGREIKVCARWMKFENFLADMGKRPEGTTLDRKENNGNYEPNNCRWGTKEQQLSTRSPRTAYLTDAERAEHKRVWSLSRSKRRKSEGHSPETKAKMSETAKKRLIIRDSKGRITSFQS